MSAWIMRRLWHGWHQFNDTCPWPSAIRAGRMGYQEGQLNIDEYTTAHAPH